MKIVVRTDGAEQLLKKLDPKSLLGTAWRQALDDTRRYGERTIHRRVPSGRTKLLEAAIVSYVDKAEFPLHAGVLLPNLPTVGMWRGKPFRYGGALEGSSRYHYRGGLEDLKRQRKLGGKQTKGWWSGVYKMMSTYLKRRLRTLEQRMEADFHR